MPETASTNTVEQRLAERAAEPDSRVIEEIRQGDRSAYGELVRRYERKLLRTLYRMVGNVATAEDLAQETFLKAYTQLQRFDNSKRFGPWLFQIGVNGAIDWLRKHRKRRMHSLKDASGDDTSFDVADPDPRPKAELSEDVRFVLDQLPVQYRTVLALRDLEGFACSEVAAIVGRQEPTVRWRLLKARQMFRDLWERRNGGKTE
jgi:RNA polymerase sigma-70 factor (ECF subfamily)